MAYALFVGADLMGEFDPRKEAESALDVLVEAEPSADDFAVFEVDESGTFVGKPITRTT